MSFLYQEDHVEAQLYSSLLCCHLHQDLKIALLSEQNLASLFSRHCHILVFPRVLEILKMVTASGLQLVPHLLYRLTLVAQDHCLQ